MQMAPSPTPAKKTGAPAPPVQTATEEGSLLPKAPGGFLRLACPPEFSSQLARITVPLAAGSSNPSAAGSTNKEGSKSYVDEEEEQYKREALLREKCRQVAQAQLGAEVLVWPAAATAAPTIAPGRPPPSAGPSSKDGAALVVACQKVGGSRAGGAMQHERCSAHGSMEQGRRRAAKGEASRTCMHSPVHPTCMHSQAPPATCMHAGGCCARLQGPVCAAVSSGPELEARP